MYSPLNCLFVEVTIRIMESNLKIFFAPERSGCAELLQMCSSYRLVFCDAVGVLVASRPRTKLQDASRFLIWVFVKIRLMVFL